MKQIKGLIVAPFTGFDQEGNLDLSKVALQQKYYKDNGITGCFVSGTTGEGSALTFDEKVALYKEWAKYSEENFALIGFVGGTSVRECQNLALEAKAAGLDAVAMTAPYYQKAANVKDLAATLAEVAAVVPELPFFYYHIPCLTNVNFPMYDLLVEMDKVIPNLGGIKYTFENMMDYQMCLYYKDHKYNIMWGRDEMLLEALAIGADTFIGSTYGYNAPIYNKIIEAFNAGEMKKAADLQYKANILITFLGKYGNGTGKAFMKAADMDLGPVRRPFRNLTEEEYEKFLAEIKAEDFDEYKCIWK